MAAAALFSHTHTHTHKPSPLTQYNTSPQVCDSSLILLRLLLLLFLTFPSCYCCNPARHIIIIIIMSSLTWFQLLDAEDGSPYMGTSADIVSLPPNSILAEFRDSVKAKNSPILSSFTSSQLVVYRNKASFFQSNNSQEQGNRPLKPSFSMDGLGTTEEEALAVVVPVFPNRAAQQVESTGKLGVLIFNSSITISIAWKEY